MPVGSAFFDTIIRQPAIDDEKLDPADNLEEFGPISEEDLDHIERSVRAAGASGCGVAATSAARHSATSRWCPRRF